MVATRGGELGLEGRTHTNRLTLRDSARPEFLLAEEGTAGVADHLFGDAWTTAHDELARGGSERYHYIGNGLEAGQSQAVLRWEVVGIGADPDTPQTSSP